MSETVISPAARPIFIDALNLAYWCGAPPSLNVPITLMSHLLAAGHRALLYFDASARYKQGDEAGLYADELQHSRYCLEVPSGRTADGVMLRHATSSGACIVSKDKFRDQRERYRKLIDDPARLLTGAVEHDRLRVPALALDVPLPLSAHDAWQQLQRGSPGNPAGAAP